uniref:Uncharacterized protein n=1 Tax=Oryctolagus cuniculus TaxID=9986 RepID=A0A5F9D317_RABIT
MDKGQSEAHANVTPVKASEMEPKKPVKHHQSSNNILIYLFNRQLGIPRNDVDLSQWKWMLM